MKMTNEQILKKAIEKAVKNGWKHKFLKGKIGILIDDPEWVSYAGVRIESKAGASNWQAVEQIIFSHDFARAFWGEKDNYKQHRERKDIFVNKNWQYHLQQLVLEKDPIKYLEKFLTKNRRKE